MYSIQPIKRILQSNVAKKFLSIGASQVASPVVVAVAIGTVASYCIVAEVCETVMKVSDSTNLTAKEIASSVNSTARYDSHACDHLTG